MVVTMGMLWDKCTFGRTRRARRMMRQLRALDLQDAAGPSRSARGGRFGRSWSTGAVSALIVVGVLAAVHFVPQLRGGTALQDAGTALRGATEPHDGGMARPPAGLGEARDVRGRPPVDVPTGPHSFLATQGDTRSPVAWDPCRQIHYVTSGVPPRGAELLVAQAVQELSKATGLQFVDDGATSEQPGSKRAPYIPQRYGKIWAPVLVAWTTPDTVPDLAGDVAGWSGPAGITPGTGPQVYVSGAVFLDRLQLSDSRTAEGRAMARGIVLHEFGHLLGLTHVADPTQIMNPVAVPGIDHLKAGDREGLARLGQGSCAPDL
jgi:hypothetical protein